MIQVVNPAGQTAPHSIPLSQTVLSLKTALHWDQVLVACGRKLQDSWTLQQCLGPDRKVYLVLQKLEEWVLFVKTTQGKVLSIDVNAKSSVSELLGLVGNRGIRNVKLIYKGKMLKDLSQLLSEAGVGQSSLLFAAPVQRNSAKVFIYMHVKNCFTLDVALEDTLSTLQTRIEEEKKVKTADQRLFIGIKELKNGTQTLTSLQITDMTAIRLISKRKNEIIIYILAPKDNIYHIQLPKSSTIAQLKAEIKQLYTIDENSELQLSLSNNILSDSQTLSAAEVKNRTKVKLSILTSVLIRDLAGKLKRISVEKGGKVAEIQAAIQVKFAVPAEKQHLKCKDKAVEPSTPLEQLFSPAAASLSSFFLPQMGLQSPQSLHSPLFLDAFFP